MFIILVFKTPKPPKSLGRQTPRGPPDRGTREIGREKVGNPPPLAWGPHMCIPWCCKEENPIHNFEVSLPSQWGEAAPPNLARLRCDNPSPEGFESSCTSNGLKQKVVRHPVGS